tara:strand:- start:97 stop:360 length:264 start_codon:yes stop_codon:yes gene_type:complete
MKLAIKIFFLSVFTVLASTIGAIAQCAMCRATVETSMADGDVTIAAGLNTGIFYLLAAPYIVISVIAYLWYKKSRENAKKVKAVRYR